MDTQRLTSTEFRLVYARTGAITQVTVLGRVIGTWYPNGTEPDGVSPAQVAVILRQRDDANEEIARLKKELAAAHRAEDRVYGTMPATVPAKGAVFTVKPGAPTEVRVGTASFNSRPFAPVPHPGKTK